MKHGYERKSLDSFRCFIRVSSVASFWLRLRRAESSVVASFLIELAGLRLQECEQVANFQVVVHLLNLDRVQTY